MMGQIDFGGIAMSDLAREEFARLYLAALDAAEEPALAARRELWSGSEAVEKLWKICDRLLDNARRFNLTAILEPGEIVRKHVLDSLIPLALLAENGVEARTILDVGTGAGFPLLPWAAVLPENRRLTGLDSTAKKISHIRECAAYAGLNSVSGIVGRAEELACGKMREKYDLVTARAVADLPVLLELCAPFVKKGGIFAAFKARGEDEITRAKAAALILGLTEPDVFRYALPGGDARLLLLYRKTAPTPKNYPRRWAEILNHPIG